MAPVKNYTPQQMSEAMEAVRKGLNLATAAKKYGVPRITLRNKVTGKSPAVCSMGPSSILTKEEEAILVQWLFGMAERHCPVSKEQLLDSVQMIIKANKKETPFTEGRPGRKWYQAFLKRHPELSERVSQNLTSSREAVTEEQITTWFSEVRQYIKDNDLIDALQDPTRIFNTDESAFFLNPNPGRVLVRKGDPSVYSSSGNEKENLTVLITGNAAGHLAPPMVVFTYERIPKNIADNVPDTWAIGKSENGWMCSSTFYEYISNVFHPWLLENKIKLPVIFFLDGHASHLTKHLSDFCSDNKIEIIALYPNSTHLLQPMDLAVFKPLKGYWRKQVRKWKAETGQSVSKDKFAGVLKLALENLSQDSIKHGFRAGGLFLFGPEYVDFSKMHAHNRKLAAGGSEPISSQDFEFFTKLEQEIVKNFTVSKLNKYKQYFYMPRNTLNEVLSAEDLTLYTIWAKYKNLCHTHSTETDGLNNPEITRELNQIREDNDSEKKNDQDRVYHANSTGIDGLNNLEITIEHNQKEKDNAIVKKINQDIECLTNSTETNVLNNQEITKNTTEEEIIQNTPVKETSSTNLAAYIKKEKNIVVPSPFKKALFWPEPVIKKKGRISKEKLPAAITSKAWKDFHEKKELEKKTKEEEKEKRKQDRIAKKAKKDVEMKNRKPAGVRANCRKRRKASVTSSDSDDSNVTFAESGESEVETEQELENDRNFENIMANGITEDKIVPSEVIQTLKDTGDTDERNNERKDEQKHVTEYSARKIQILECVDLVLDEKTGKFTPSKIKTTQAKEGEYVLVKFNSENAHKTYRYVCIIKEMFGEKIVVQGLRFVKIRLKF